MASASENTDQAYAKAEEDAAKAMEDFVASQGFGSLLGQLGANVAALSKIGADSMDLLLRNLRLAGRRDVVRLSSQLARTEDKLERVLQEIEMLRDGLAGDAAARTPAAMSVKDDAKAGERGTR